VAVDTTPGSPVAGSAAPGGTREPRRPLTLPSGSVISTFLVLFLVIASVSVEGFASTRNAGFLLLDVAVIALIALPLTLIVVTGEIDLSVASSVGLSSAVMGKLWFAGLPLETIIPLVLLLGAVLGAVNGFLVTKLGLPSLAVTIGTLALYRGLAFVVLGDQAVADFPRSWTTWAISGRSRTTSRRSSRRSASSPAASSSRACSSTSGRPNSDRQHPLTLGMVIRPAPGDPTHP
jgi:rhamnose transport system permease protein